MIANEIPGIANSVWTATANPTPDFPALRGRAETDVAVIGGGYTGLSAALHLAERGVSVTLLESETPGWGASGRNGGQVNPGLKEDPDTVRVRFGVEMGERMIAMSGASGDLVADLVRRHGIDCGFAQKGWVQPIHDDAAMKTVSERVAQWTRRDAPMRLLSRDEAADILGSTAYQGAMIDERGGKLHPLNYAIGLARAARDAGAVLHSHSRVSEIRRDGAGSTIVTAEGQLSARRVLVCTNAYTGDPTPRLARTQVPVRSIQVATDPLGDDLRRSILPRGHSASDSRRLLLYFRFDDEGRFLIGGRGDYSERGVERQFAALRRAAAVIYPQLADIEWRYAWGGFVSITTDHYPHLHRLSDNAMTALGYMGRGVAMATAMGRELADWAAGTPAEELNFPVTPMRPIPFHFLRKPAVAAAVTWARFRDVWG
ncbi:FAD-binding oxidoreductase [Roseovarius spongiae]|uniref:FAD-binding oxidoreductase n=1 Tax=Roseovarius spongiae TaxID=2320272 RepID=A0A3A8B915_9RHOB|nr:FAD-binding oxidoreductase [Roseovarius spongiae]RKF14166.1 FAD-binding oxidoreductase [Roseovarius spongiae]